MGKSLERMPLDLVNVQPLKQTTVSIEDVVRYEMAIEGYFELRGNDMDSLYVLAGL